MNQTIKKRIEQIGRGEVPEGYKKTKAGLAARSWVDIKIGDYIEEYLEKTTIKNQYPILTSARKGIMLQSDYYSNNQVTTEDNIGYNIIPRGYITYRSRSDDGKFRFNENNIVDKGMISYFYPVFSFKSNCNKNFMLELLNFTIYRQAYSFVEGTAQQVLSFKKLQSLRYTIPPLEEQERIAEILGMQDKLIVFKEKRIAEKKQQKKYLMQQLLTGKKRLPGFTGEWKLIKLGDVLLEGSKKAVEDTSKFKKMTVKLAFKGLEFSKIDREMADTRPFYVRGENEIIIGKQNYFNGSVAIVTKEFAGCICSNAIMSFVVHDADAKYIFEYICQRDFMKKYEMLANGTGQKELSEKDFLNFSIKIPTIEEQQAIADILSQADKEIELLQKDLEEEKNKKKALMQLLLTGIVRAV